MNKHLLLLLLPLTLLLGSCKKESNIPITTSEKITGIWDMERKTIQVFDYKGVKIQEIIEETGHAWQFTRKSTVKFSNYPPNQEDPFKMDKDEHGEFLIFNYESRTQNYRIESISNNKLKLIENKPNIGRVTIYEFVKK